MAKRDHQDEHSLKDGSGIFATVHVFGVWHVWLEAIVNIIFTKCTVVWIFACVLLLLLQVFWCRNCSYRI